MESIGADKPYAVPQQEQIDPSSLHFKMRDQTDRRQVWRGIAAQRETVSYEAGIGKVSAVIMVDLDLASKHLLENRLDIPVTIWPVLVNKSNGEHHTDQEGTCQAQLPSSMQNRLRGYC